MKRIVTKSFSIVCSLVIMMIAVITASSWKTQIKANAESYAPTVKSITNDEYTRGLHIYQYLKSHTKWNDAVVCGILAHLYQESRYKPTSENESSGAFGIAQWLGDRKANLLKLNNNKDVDVQLNYLINEIDTGYGNFKTIKNLFPTIPNTADGAYTAAYNYRLKLGWVVESDFTKKDSQIIGNNAKNFFYPKFAPALEYTVTFNANGGKCTTANKKVTKGSTYGTLPTPTKPGYSFTGWFTAATGGTKIAATTTVSITANQTLYAQWTPAKPSWTPYQFKGSGTQADPYQISSATELVEMQKLVNCQYYNPTYGKAYYIQTADIDLSGIKWIPIGLGKDDSVDGAVGMGDYNYNTRMFNGVYDGNQRIIKNFSLTTVYKPNGLFGYIRGKDAGIYNLVVYGKIETDGNSDTGGIVGQMQYNSKIENCGFIGNISSKSNIGGIAGDMWNGGSIINCYHTGSVNGQNSAGIVGLIAFDTNGNDSIAEIKNCYQADGLVTGTNTAHAIVGSITRNSGVTNKVNIVNCFASDDSETDIKVTGADVNTALIRTGAELRGMADDLGDAFKNNRNTSLNGGYPVFPWQIEFEVGDCNSDGILSSADAVMLQKYILKSDIKLTDWKAADLNSDNIIDTLDMILMRKLLITVK